MNKVIIYCRARLAPLLNKVGGYWQLNYWYGKYLGVICRMNETTYDSYFLGVTPIGKGMFMATIIEIQGGKLNFLVQMALLDAPKAKTGDGYTVRFICQGNKLQIAGGEKVGAEAKDSSYKEGSIALAVYSTGGKALGFFDNLVVNILP
jgi:hypothetical protein